MEVMVAVQSGTLLHALRVQLKRRVSARRGGDYNGMTTFKNSRRFNSFVVVPSIRLRPSTVVGLCLNEHNKCRFSKHGSFDASVVQQQT